MVHLIQRDRTLNSTGDAIEFALGAYSHEMPLWFVVYYSDALKALISQNVFHINGLVFATILIQLVAYIVYFETPELHAKFVSSFQLPTEPVFNITMATMVNLRSLLVTTSHLNYVSATTRWQLSNDLSLLSAGITTSR